MSPYSKGATPSSMKKQQREKYWEVNKGEKKTSKIFQLFQLSSARIKDGDGFQPLLSAPSNIIFVCVCVCVWTNFRGGRCMRKHVHAGARPST